MPNRNAPKNLLEWLCLTELPKWRVARPLGALFGVLSIVLFAFALIASFIVLGQVISGEMLKSPSGSLGAGALIVALLSAPFLIWGTIIKQQTVNFQKEGHLTDRISKAVEQLGAEKTSNAIGRSVTIWTGRRGTVHVEASLLPKYEGQPRTVIGSTELQTGYNPETDQIEDRYFAPVSQWSGERTEIQWHDSPLQIQDHETIGHEGAWQNYQRTLPNTEVRIGGLLSLERIAQDSVAYDKGRDHVRVMEIICAYVRENAAIEDPFVHLENGDRSWKKSARIDIEAAMHILGGPSGTRISRQSPGQATPVYRSRLNLRKVNLAGADLRDLSMANIDFSGSSFMHANMMNTKFTNVLFNGSNFYRAKTGTASADRETVFSYCLFSDLESLRIIENVARDQVLCCAIKSTRFDHEGLDRLRAGKRTIFSVWFGDGSVEMPMSSRTDPTIEWPKSWTRTNLDLDSFMDGWRKWQANPDTYPDTPPTT